MGAALPVLLAGTSIGLASGIGGGAAAVTEKIIKSRQLKQAQESIDADKEATCHLEEDISKLRSNKKVVNKIAKDVIVSGGSAAYDSVQIFNLVAGKAGAANTLKAGIEATAQLLGEDVGKEVSLRSIPIRDLLLGEIEAFFTIYIQIILIMYFYRSQRFYYVRLVKFYQVE